MPSIVKSVFIIVCALLCVHQVSAASVPICHPSVADYDGDGWGHEHNQSCRILSACTDTDGDGWGWDGMSSCLMSDFYAKYHLAAPCTDSDGDGWGWDGYRSCRMPNSETQSKAIATTPLRGGCVDFDGDGWGWDGVQTCALSDTQTNNTQTNNTQANNALTNNDLQKVAAVPIADKDKRCAQIQSGRSPMADLVTDVVLTAGQSNAAGNKTVYDRNHPLDQVNSRILAWTSNQKWEVANPATQVWDANRFPKSPGQQVGFNHPAFQIARSIVQQDNCRVVAIVASSASGQPIAYWLDDVDSHFSTTSKKVTTALAQLPHKNRVDMIWWMQGESDNHPNYFDYNSELKRLIELYRSQSWFDSNRYFLANETGWFGNVNRGIRLLASDGDKNTNYSANPVSLHPGKILHIVSEDATVHFNETALRIIGDLVRDEYLFDYRERVAD